MDNFNKKEICYCKYCNKECHSRNSLIQHEIRCSKNENKIINIINIKGNIGKTKGYIVINKDNIEKHIPQNILNNYLNDGWKLGMSPLNKEKNKIAANKYIHSGICKDENKEKERRLKISKSMKGNENWKLNKIRGNGKKGHYNGIYCDSTWELAFLVYYNEHNLKVERCKEEREYLFNNEKHFYYPDFITDEGIIEVKGRIDKKAIEKHKQNLDIIVYDKYKMKPILEYVIHKYGKEFWKVLYDKYK